MERDQSGAPERHGRQSPRRAVVLGGTLALLLACRTLVQTQVWASESALWAHAQHVAPSAPRPWIGLAAAEVYTGDPVLIDAWLDRAAAMAWRQSPAERAWALDSIGATRATLRMRQGRFREAAVLMRAGPPESERWKLCRHFRSVCALA